MIDFHCHLDLYPDPVAVTREASLCRAYVLSVTTTPKAWRNTLRLAKGASRIRTALGLHPQVAHERHRELALFEALLPETDYVGEVGLDGSAEFKMHSAVQKRVFESVLSMSARAGGRVLSLHSRAAVEPLLESLARKPDAGIPVLHWFTGSASQMRRAADQGCWFSVGLPMTRSERGRAILAALPRDRVLTESDGPFVQIGSRPFTPSDIPLVVSGLAGIWDMTTEEVQDGLASNLREIGKIAAKGGSRELALGS
ncbi:MULTISPECIES: Qat anti-phage system TatD family nuclease QatD [unclassified Bradyrhizobium]|uniref:Qat anti-phage system TatD family nuclease QatD n=1 Tax=unclassified Bradyrhizobium TaxID=2631580 RepID=UPI0009E6EA0A|nr:MULTISPECIES: Qat anti-phage system TatD family nuclease QatD [unclassified Bradyrhizobium]